MKKFYLIYAIILLILLLFCITGGIPHGIALVYREAKGIDDVSKKSLILIFNILVTFICFVVTIVLAISKSNTIKIKWLIPVVMLLLFAFLPVSMKKQSGGGIYRTQCEFYSTIEFIREEQKEVDERFNKCIEEHRWLDLIK